MSRNSWSASCADRLEVGSRENICEMLSQEFETSDAFARDEEEGDD